MNHGANGMLVGLALPVRRTLANEFGIKHIHFVPVVGGEYVMEYGRIAGEVFLLFRSCLCCSVYCGVCTLVAREVFACVCLDSLICVLRLTDMCEITQACDIAGSVNDPLLSHKDM